jgi:hypothetical protein
MSQYVAFYLIPVIIGGLAAVAWTLRKATRDIMRGDH